MSVVIAAVALASAMNAAAMRLVDTQKAVGVQYAVLQNGTVTASGALGRANIATNAPVTDETRFRIASVTKLFTAVAVMQLVERGVLSLDDTLAKFQPSFPNASSITVRDLLMHRSGISNYFDAALASGATKAATTPQAIVDSMAAKPPLSAPGSTFSYSNTNYVLLGLIVERVSGQPLHEYYRANIFTPAGMTHTFAGSPPAGVPVAVGYATDDGAFSPYDAGDVSWSYACGDIWSTALDLARFDVALTDGVLLKATTFRNMIDAALPATMLGPRVGYGLGVTIAPSGGSDPFVGHHGGVPGFEADDEMLPADRFAVISLGNLYTYPTAVMNATAIEALYPDRMRALQAQAVADAQAQAANEDPALTQRFTTFLTDLLAGKIDAAGLSSAMASAMTPDATKQVAALFAKDGAFVKLRYTSQDAVDGYRRYHYAAVFATASQPLTFVLDPDGKIAGFFLR